MVSGKVPVTMSANGRKIHVVITPAKVHLFASYARMERVLVRCERFYKAGGTWGPLAFNVNKLGWQVTNQVAR